mmetsp:Transcript_19294/g.38191  ORF Transcript_19294/g.38191 Transcript_19294/m.38191 type:complete len:109 (-) Transcript_19294:45-371(-)
MGWLFFSVCLLPHLIWGQTCTVDLTSQNPSLTSSTVQGAISNKLNQLAYCNNNGSNLVSLSFGFNQITTLPGSMFTNMTSLAKLQFLYNQIPSLPTSSTCIFSLSLCL